jgi:hypothetical protein
VGTLTTTSGAPTLPTASSKNTTKPSVSFLSPLPNTPVKNSFTATVDATDASGVASVVFKFDAVSLRTDVSAPYDVTIDTSSYVNGTHILTAVATNRTGGITSTSLAVNIQNTSESTDD